MAKEIGLAHDTDELALLVDNREAADVARQHQPHRIPDRRLGLDGDHPPRHDVHHLHFGYPTVWAKVTNCSEPSCSVRPSFAWSSEPRNTLASPSEAQNR